METSLHGGLRGTPLDLQVEEEVYALSIVIIYKQQLEEMYAALCQVHSDLPYDVLLEGEETCDGWEEEIYEQISFRQRDAIDRARTIDVFYDCVEMLQQVKDMFAGVLVRRHASGPLDTETWTASTATTPSTTSSTTSVSSTTAITARSSTTTTSTVVNTVILPIMTSMTITSLSIAATPSSNQGCVQQWELPEQAHDAWGLEEGPSPCMGLADRLRSNALMWRSCKAFEEGRGLCGEIDKRFHDDDDDDTVDGLCDCSSTADYGATKDDGLVDKNNNNNHIACNNKTCNNNKHGDGIRWEVSVIRLFLSPLSSLPIPFSLLHAVGNNRGQGREGWVIGMCGEQEEGAGMWGEGWWREGAG
ncbi:hypothetical protein CBR_g32334 [Chara braunii]|uniref:Uncharacterized protein n=1 Tax=Chara braunii TaxID=69332 RepID=A0A388JNP0_CHABU|nr:hypothetical protein CBR_g32334 [Chara braunii]|eukprot:GBG59322.1 hypothetical protein CBR_g32334 [Chara braunii]